MPSRQQIDEKVVSMKFDNKNFEKNVKESLSTLDKLKEKLNFKDSTKGFEEIDNASKKVSFSKMEQSLDSLNKKFSVLGVAGATTINRLTNMALDFAKTLNSFSFGGIIEGGKARATKIEDAKFQIKGLLGDATDAASQLDAIMDDVNYGVADTAYGLDAAASVAAQLAASGMRAGDEMKSALRGISGVAAMTGSSYEDIGRIFTQVAGQGRLMGDDLLQLSSRGMNAAAILGKSLGKSESEVRDMVSKGKIDFATFSKAMDDAFGQHAKDANKTLNGVLSNIRAALAKIGADFYQPIITQESPLVMFLNDVRDRINEIRKTVQPLSKELSTGLNNLITEFDKYFKNHDILAFNPLSGLKDQLKDASNMTDEQLNSIEQLKKVSEQTAIPVRDLVNLMNTEDDSKNIFGTRYLFLNSIKNVIFALVDVLKDFGKAWSDTFSESNNTLLFNIAAGLNKFSTILRDKVVANSDKLVRTFKGFFSIVAIGIDIIKAFVKQIEKVIGSLTGTSGTLLDVTAKLGDFFVKLRKTTKESNVIEKIFNQIGNGISIITGAISKLFNFLLNSQSIKNVVSRVFGFILDVIKTTMQGINAAIKDGGSKELLSNINTGIFGAILINVNKFIKNMNKEKKKSKSIVQGIKDILSDVEKCLVDYQKNIKADTLMKIAKAIGILTASIFVLATINPERLGSALHALTVSFGELILAMYGYEKLMSKTSKKNGSISESLSDFLGGIKGSFLMLSMAGSMVLLASALKIISKIDPDRLWNAVSALTVCISVMTIAVNALKSEDTSKGEKNASKAASSFVKIANSMLIVAISLRILSKMNWDQSIRALSVMELALIELLTSVYLLSKVDTKQNDITKSAKVLRSLANTMLILSGVLKILATMSWDDIGRSLSVMGGAIGELLLATFLLAEISKIDNASLVKSAIVMRSLSNTALILSGVLKILATMSWDDIHRSLTAMGGALGELVIVMGIMSKISKEGKSSMKNLINAGAILIMANAVLILSGALKVLASIKLEDLAKGLGAIAAAFGLLYAAGTFLGPLVPALLGIAGAIALFGAGAALFGIGVQAVSLGIKMLIDALAGGAEDIVTSLKNIVMAFADMLPALIKDLGLAIVALCDVIIESAPKIAEAALEVIYQVVKNLATYAPQITEQLALFIIGLFNTLATYIPQIIDAFINFCGALFKKIKEVIGSMSEDSIQNAVKTLTGLIVIMGLFAVIKHVAVDAILGIVEFGFMLTELATVIALVGELKKIDGFKDLVDDGGEILQSVGNAIGKFIGGIVGGIGKAVSSTLPSIGKDLSDFMTNASPFFEMIKTIKPESAEAALNLSKCVQNLASAGFKDAITKIISKGTDYSGIGDTFGGLAIGLKTFSSTISTISDDDMAKINTASKALEGLANLSKQLQLQDGALQYIIGKKDLGQFGSQLVPLGIGISLFVNSLTDVTDDDLQKIVTASNALMDMADLASKLQLQDGALQFLIGQKDLGKFGSQLAVLGGGLSLFEQSIEGVSFDNMPSAITALGQLIGILNLLPDSGGVAGWIKGDKSLSTLGSQLESLGNGYAKFGAAVSGKGVDPSKCISAASALNTIISSFSSLNSKTFDPKTISSFGNSLPALGNGFASFANSISKIPLLSDKDSNLSGALSSFKAITSALSKLKTVAATDISGFNKAMGELGKTSFGNFSKAFNDDAKKSVNSMIKSISSSLDSVISAFKGGKNKNSVYYTKFHEAGSYLAQGFINGIKSKSKSVTQAGIDMGNQALNGAKSKKSTAERSPSRATYKIGEFFVAGFVNAIKDNSDNAYKQSSVFGSKSVTAFNDAISKISDSVDDDIDTDPVITPVLDLSNVEQNSAKLSSMLDNQNMNISANLNAINSNISRASQNGINDDVVSAINKLGKSLGNTNTGNTYNLNGISYDDGSSISEAVKTLVNAIEVERRV